MASAAPSIGPLRRLRDRVLSFVSPSVLSMLGTPDRVKEELVC